MGYKPKVGDIVEIRTSRFSGKIGIIEKINKEHHNNGQVDVRLLEIDRLLRNLFIGDIKLISSLDKQNMEWYSRKNNKGDDNGQR